MYKSDVNSFFLWILKAVLHAVFACSSWPLLSGSCGFPQRASLLQGNGSPNHISSNSYVQSMTKIIAPSHFASINFNIASDEEYGQ